MKKVVARRLKATLQDSAVAASAGAQNLEGKRSQIIRATIAATDLDYCMEDVRSGRVYTIKAVAKALKCSEASTRTILQREPGVIKGGRSFVRVPETVLKRLLVEILRVDS